MGNQQKYIAHYDLDSFFVSVEILLDPTLKGKPVIVGGSERGVVSTCSYEARKFGVHSAMPSSKARQLCPEGIFVKGHYAEYSKYSKRVTQIIAAIAPLFEKASVDEFYIDLTGMTKFFNPLQWCIDLRNKIIAETGLPISFGLASNKMMAKMATNAAKPNGYLQIPHGSEMQYLSPLPASDIPGVGTHTTQVLQSMGIQTVKDIYALGEPALEERLGKWGKDLWYKSQGIHEGTVGNYHEAKSISSEHTFSENKTDLDFLNSELIRLTEKIAFELRTDEKKATCITVKIRYSNFETKTIQAAVQPTDADDEMIPVVKTLFKKLYKKDAPVRLLGVRLSDFKNEQMQGNLFNDAEKKKGLYKAIDTVKNRFGRDSVKRASSG